MSGKNSVMSKITVQEHVFGDFALVYLTSGSCTSPTDTSPFTYHPFNGPVMCAVDNFQRLRFGNSQSPDKFTGKPKIVSFLTSSQDSVKQKSMFMFTVTSRTIYKVSGTARYIKMCWPASNNNTILATLLQDEEDNFSKLMVKNRLKIDRNKYVPNKWQISSPQELCDDYHL